MIIKLDDEVIAGSGSEGHSNLRINGRQIVHEPDFLRAASIDVFNRDNQRTTLTFQTSKLFDDQAEAEVWMLERYPTMLSLCGLLILTAKSETKEIDRWCEKAAVVSLGTSEMGVSITLFWEIHAGKILTEKP